MIIENETYYQPEVGGLRLVAQKKPASNPASGNHRDDPQAKRSSSRAPQTPVNRAFRIVIAGGGTGGHLFPGIAIAKEFMARNSATRVIFVSTGNRLEKAVLSKAGFELRSIQVAGIKGRGTWNQIKSVFKIPGAILAGMGLLKDFAPDLIVGLGSYSAGPVVIGAWLKRIPIAIHEQNILPGITNKILAHFADRIYISFKNTQSRLSPQKVYWTGNPVRQELLEISGQPEGGPAQDISQGQFTVLIIGGSQGAHRINTAMIEALEHLQNSERLHFVHQTGEADQASVSDAYRKKSVSSTVQSFFDNMAEQYRPADLIICRAGATTVAEITALGKAAIFIPFPYAADNHQMLNAADLADDGAAEIIIEKELTGILLSQKIEHYMGHRKALEDMAARARRHGNPAAAKNIVDDCYRLLTK
ncbi:MAG: undecaprenyldiphospho-muramoylpentapeptide beta-N-acetylglucosaminyltransferase [Desulfobacteraceae bacterium]|jgi:UDP-N-acetylglucosamine--N-acetylmuramyl-(pentapeptide) pyrophosphoryl-undecaprenol N-acetylglucosamine transferase|nr:undecaprenyldiphospho-muramoylpentapeptide beta-N-acetylglucosaminyltransferase [Desulfobacteraceae bacterium]